MFHKFLGGKGVATALGVLMALDLQLGLGALALWLLVFMVWRVSSLSALAASAIAPLLTVQLYGWGWLAGSVLVMSLLLLWRHKSNIMGLISGTEGNFKSPDGS